MNVHKDGVLHAEHPKDFGCIVSRMRDFEQLPNANTRATRRRHATLHPQRILLSPKVSRIIDGSPQDPTILSN